MLQPLLCCCMAKMTLLDTGKLFITNALLKTELARRCQGQCVRFRWCIATSGAWDGLKRADYNMGLVRTFSWTMAQRQVRVPFYAECSFVGMLLSSRALQALILRIIALPQLGCRQSTL